MYGKFGLGGKAKPEEAAWGVKWAQGVEPIQKERGGKEIDFGRKTQPGEAMRETRKDLGGKTKRGGAGWGLKWTQERKPNQKEQSAEKNGVRE